MRPSLDLHLRGKTILLTGSTGFLGKVIIERLLRYAPDLERIYLLIRPQPESDPPASAAMRFETEILASRAFAGLARAHGDRWQAFARRKIVPVDGDVSQPRLGFAATVHAALASRVDIIINP